MHGRFPGVRARYARSERQCAQTKASPCSHWCTADSILPDTFACLIRTEYDVKIELTALEARVIGCLIEKAITTPDQYPLSLNALTNACNQKSNRDPVLELEERTVQQTLDDLGRKHFVVEKSGFGRDRKSVV